MLGAPYHSLASSSRLMPWLFTRGDACLMLSFNQYRECATLCAMSSMLLLLAGAHVLRRRRSYLAAGPLRNGSSVRSVTAADCCAGQP